MGNSLIKEKTVKTFDKSVLEVGDIVSVVLGVEYSHCQGRIEEREFFRVVKVEESYIILRDASDQGGMSASPEDAAGYHNIKLIAKGM